MITFHSTYILKNKVVYRCTMVSIEETYKLQNEIISLEKDLKAKKQMYEHSLNELIETNHTETKYYKIKEVIKSGRSFINIPLFQKLYKKEFSDVVKFNVTITDAKKVLSGDQLNKVVNHYDDIIVYEIVKK